MEGPLWAALDEPLPEHAWCGAGTSWYLTGWCFHEEHPVDDLEIVIGEQATAVLGRAGRRPDVHAALVDVPTDDRRPLAFWTLVDLAPGDESPRAVKLRARLADGSVVDAELGHTTPVRDDRLRLDLHSDARLAIAMATYEPPAALFAIQIASLRAQTFTDWVCVVCDDGSNPEALDRMVVELSGDPRFVLVRNHDTVGHYRNFERALRLLPQGPQLVALSDQDDVWYPEKLARTIGALDRDDAVLVATACRLVRDDGRVRGHLYEDIAPNVDDLCAALITSTLAGASMVFRRTLLEQALPFPPTSGDPVHDHWLAAAAIAQGNVTFLSESTYDWVQHSDNTLGWPEEASLMVPTQYRKREIFGIVRSAADSCFALTIPIAQRARTLALRGAAASSRANQALLEAIGGPGAGLRREWARLGALAASGDRRLLRGADRPARMGAVWMAAHGARRHARMVRPRWHRRVAASNRPTRAQTARCDDGPVPVLTEPRAAFARDRPRTVAVVPARRVPPARLGS